MRTIASSLAAAAALMFAAPASATTLIDFTDMPQQFVTSQSLTFTATSTSTEIDFEGYQLPASLVLVNIFLGITGTTPSTSSNLLDANFTYTPASCGPYAGEGSLGAFGTYDLTFGGMCPGIYDSFTQTVSTAVGTSYTLQFVFSNIGTGPNGLRISASDPLISAVPEPATWAMMLIGFGAIGMTMRRRRSARLVQIVSNPGR